MATIFSALKCKLFEESSNDTQAMHETKTISSLSSSNATSTNSTLDQQKPLIVGTVLDEQHPEHMPNLLQSTAKRFRMIGRTRVSFNRFLS
jgi:hypothetical protein